MKLWDPQAACGVIPLRCRYDAALALLIAFRINSMAPMAPMGRSLSLLMLGGVGVNSALAAFDGATDVRLREARALQHALRSAVPRELLINYQPQLSIARRLVGFEALLRWQHPTRGLIPPATFIPLAEDGGLIFTIGAWVLREACREAASWPKPVQLSVNLSPVQFRQGNLAGLVQQILSDTGLTPARLELEITEGALIHDHDRAMSILRELKALGVHIALDDFGTGYSSLSYLQSFPIDKIKIVRSFVRV